jgi:hypothetical protein
MTICSPQIGGNCDYNIDPRFLSSVPKLLDFVGHIQNEQHRKLVNPIFNHRKVVNPIFYHRKLANLVLTIENW